MTLRLGRAIAAHIQRQTVGTAKAFLLVEGVSVEVASGICDSWAEGMPTLAVVSSSATFGAFSMGARSGTSLRNLADGRGVVIVLCEGETVDDRQSLNLFDTISPGDLLDSPEGIALLAKQSPPVVLDGPLRSVRQAINSADARTRPSALAVSRYFDEVASGADPRDALPTLGCFRDRSADARLFDADRVSENLLLAARRTSEELLRAGSYADLRKRAELVLRARPGLTPAKLPSEVDRLISLLQSGSPDLLSELAFDEAREVLEQRALDLARIVRAEIGAFRTGSPAGSPAFDLPWDRYLSRTEDLKKAATKRDAAQEFLDLDDAQMRAIFLRPTRSKLERLLRDRPISASSPSSPEAGFIRAIQVLSDGLSAIHVIAPLPPSGQQTTTRTGAGKAITIAAARVRLGGLCAKLKASGVDVDGLLLKASNDDDLPDLSSAFLDSAVGIGAALPAMQLRLVDKKGQAVQLDWRPDIDDVAVLRAALCFAEQDCIALTMQCEPTLQAFAGGNAVAPVVVDGDELLSLSKHLRSTAKAVLDSGLTPGLLSLWTDRWSQAVEEAELSNREDSLEALTLAGAVRGLGSAVSLTPFAPLKSEWLSQYLEALWGGIFRGLDEVNDPDIATTAAAISRTSATHYPAHLRLRTQDRVLLPTSESRVWSLFGGGGGEDDGGYSGEVLTSVVSQLLTLQPEASGHLRCVAWGPGASSLLVRQGVRLIEQGHVGRIEIFCVGEGLNGAPSLDALAYADEALKASRDVLELRYVDSLDDIVSKLRSTAESPVVHLALVTGITDGGQRLQVESPEVDQPVLDTEVLFAPRVWQRAKQDRRTLLMPPTATRAGSSWLRLQHATDDGWPADGARIKVPEIRTGTLDIARELRQLHDLALWVATLDRYATRDSLEQALGKGNVAILHQERRLGGDSPTSLVLSQKSGGPADRAIGRSLRAAGIVAESRTALGIGTKLREVASQGYGILALQAATSGAGINELVGHVVAFSLLSTTTTPWPLPPGCRVLLVSLDEYRHWFPSKRADLLAIALDPEEGGVHVATIEVKARRSDETDASSSALDQLNQTLAATRWAAYPEPGSVHSRLWLNRIAEAAYAVARESRFKLDSEELAALEAFRNGTGTLEWAGVGLVFGPKVADSRRVYRASIGGDIVPVVIHSVRLTEALLEHATSVNLTDLRTVESEAAPLSSSRKRRRPEANSETAKPAGEPRAQETSAADLDGATPETVEPKSDAPDSFSGGHASEPFVAPLLGWEIETGKEVRWHPAGEGQDDLQNGHTEIWGSSGMGKTQFTMSLLAQLSKGTGTRFTVADFKNDYSSETGFVSMTGAEFVDLWNEGAPYNPLALADTNDRTISAAIIELRDAVDEATKSFTRMGVKQRGKLEQALHDAYAEALLEDRWPTLLTLNDHLDADLSAVLGDLTRHQLFKSGKPLGSIVEDNVVFGLSTIPGNGQTTVLAAGFILSSLLLTIQALPPVPNTVRNVVVVDEAHRVSGFRALQTMLREGRSKGLAVLLATQQPLDLPEVAATNAQTKICFGLPDATVATIAARKLQPDNPRLSEQIRTLGVGEAFVSFRGKPPVLVRMVQAHRDGSIA